MPKVTHYAPTLWGGTACGRSTHGWQGKRTPLFTAVLRDVTCIRCQKAVAK